MIFQLIKNQFKVQPNQSKMSEVGRPQTSTQTSRKGKRSWRKNVDISDIEKKLQEQREEIIQHGKPLSEIESEDLFIIDEDADEAVEKKLIKENGKKLKSTEILENRSKVPALLGKVSKSKKNDGYKIQGVDKKEMIHLLKLAGKVKGYDKTDERMAKEGIINAEAYDVWNTVLEDERKLNELPMVLKESSSISFTKATIVPKTLKEAPIQVSKLEILPHAGKSYNPSFENWKGLIEQEYFKEKSKDDQRLIFEEYRDRIQFLISNYEDNEIEENEEDTDDEKKNEVEDNGADENEDANKAVTFEGLQLSINPITQVNIKTKAQRNKEKRYKERQKLETDLKEIKLRIKELEKLPDILQQIESEGKKTVSTETKDDRQLRKGRKKLGSRFEVIEGPIEVKLSNELSDSLRKLKPEGNLLYDQMKGLQSKGMIETRRINKGKKGKKKITEKWSYKDFK